MQEQLCTCLTRYERARRELDRVRDVLLEDLPPLCVSLLQRRDHASAYIDLLRSYLMEVLGGSASLPPRRGRRRSPSITCLSCPARRQSPPWYILPPALSCPLRADTISASWAATSR